MKTNQGFAPLALIIILAVAVIGGGTFYFLTKDKSGNTQKPISTPSETHKNTPEENSSLPGLIQEKQTTTPKPAVKTQDTLTTNVVNCGMAGVITFTSQSSGGNITSSGIKADASTKKAWECFTDRLEVCSVAKIKASGLGQEQEIEYSILRKSENLCEVAGPKISLTDGKVTNVVCKIPMTYINFAYKESEKLYPNQKFAKGYTTTGVITAGGGEIPYPDGTKGIIGCK